MLKKILFLEYKFRDFSDDELKRPHADGVMASLGGLNKDRIKQIKDLGFAFGISFVVFPGGSVCPLSPQALSFLNRKLKKIITLKPNVIWFDYLKFQGKWGVVRRDLSETHRSCKFCEGKDRLLEIVKIAKDAVKLVPRKIKTGYFAMPYEEGEYGGWEKILGQDHKRLGFIFDYISPMLYHRMIGKRVSYISEYVKYLNDLDISAEIIPIIQLKDMPDELPDKLTLKEIEQEVDEATKSPSAGVAVFSWDQTIEKGRLDRVSRILRKI
ncbi:hypothetical protein IID21_00410 [Patescibacteria group bacterium]|nr:hypothetical protein [Patescibacteria group bacterium]